MKRVHKAVLLAIVAMIAMVPLISCGEEPMPTVVEPGTPAWMNVELTDVTTGETFRIVDFRGKTIFLESFAVWCPTCLRQQKEMKELFEQDDENIVHISLDTDPNEDEDKVRGHAERNDLGWYFAVSPIQLTNALRDEFGLDVINAPGAPVILICPDLSADLLRRGVKSSSDLIHYTEEDCG